jgi:predicted DCC family thiol-disulfide oxidoreductase YuxK
MRRLTILYDARCGLCSWARRWARRQPAFVELIFLAADSPEARRRFPGLAHEGEAEELVVISDEGGVYRGDDAWIMCLYALEDFREWSLRLASPALRPLARAAFALVTRSRRSISRRLGLAPDAELIDTLALVDAPACRLGVAGEDG